MSTPRADIDQHHEHLPMPDLESHRIGEYCTGQPGPLFIFVGGLHGNEPAGVLALQSVLAELEDTNLPLRGRLVCLAGNLEALRRGCRYIAQDLNRIWQRRDPSDSGDDSDRHEHEVRRTLQELIDGEISRVSEPVLFLDLHSTSAGGAPFTIIADTRQNRRIASALPVPMILGLEESVDGALLGFFGEQGHIAIGFEGGQHDEPQTVRNHIAAVWITLIKSGGLSASEAARRVESLAQLRAAGRGYPGVIEMRYRHHIEPTDGFVMRAGFSNFDRVKRGQPLARDAEGEIVSGEDGLILLPLYQGQGDDGFYIAREVRRFWLRASALLRAVHLDSLLPLLPGIRRVADEVETLEIRSRFASRWVIELFYLLGFRRQRSVGGRLRFSRRAEGLDPLAD